ncbi:MAG: site-specific DNA-methyltransferase [Phycisphaeraceae bacterium]|nr:site-specific DNA-methyltransferase [Phycisphaeraceae bacterium]
MSPPTKNNTPQADLRTASAESMTFIEDDSVDLVVTSPPYWNARAYDEYEKGSKSYKKRNYTKGFVSYDEYLALMTRCFSEAFRVTKPGGMCCVIVSGVLYKKKHYPIPADLSKRMRDIGWEQREELVWDKTHSACDRFGTFALHRGPHYFYPNIQTERILVFSKPGPSPRNTTDPATREASRLPLTPLATREIGNDVWHVAASRHGEVDHPAPYPQDLIARLILLYSYKGDLVLDPFLGSGQTMVVANAYGRNFVGVDVEENFVEYARSRIGEPLRLRNKQLVARYEHIEGDAFLDPRQHGREGRGTVDDQECRRPR